MGEKRRISYEDAKRMAIDEDPQVRRALAARPDVMPEILFYLANDPAPEVREAIAANAATPHRADLHLAKDAVDSVRSRLATKIGGVLPNVSAEEAHKLGMLTYKALDVLAQDQITRVRQIVAEALKDVAHAPTEVINRLARDAELVVAGPILENSPVLTDDDLVAIVSDGPIKGALASIASRDRLAGAVADAVARTGDVEAVGVMLSNSSAQIREDTLDWIVERAPGVEAWHAPLVRRPKLPGDAAQRIAQFVADRLLKVLMDRGDFDAGTVEALKSEVRKRIEGQRATADKRRIPAPAGDDRDGEGMPAWKKARAQGRTALDAATSLKNSSGLGALTVLDALTDGDDEFVIASLAVMADVPYAVAEKIAAMQSAKGIVSLAWRANLPERLLAQLQNKLCRIPPDEILKPRRQGGFPLTEDEMAWQLEFFYQLVAKGG